MTTIYFDENIELEKKHFKSLDDFQLHLLQLRNELELSDIHKRILDDRIIDADNNPNDFMDIQELRKSINRK
jgi:hypothetical protein